MSQRFSKEEIEAALQIAHSEYFMQVVALTSHYDDITDLTFSKTAVVTPEGGTYLVSILHIDGPKLNLKGLAEAATATEKEK